MDEPLIRYRDVEIKHQEYTVLCNVNLEVGKGEFLYIMGKVGSGKSSLLKTLYAELDIAQGEALIMGYNLRKLKSKHIPPLRRKLGIVFQDFQLLTDRCVYDNLYFVLRATGWKDRVAIESRIEEVLAQVGMAHKGYKFPSELSGGEQQRISIARALLNSPELILADEPTGNLDPETGRYIVELLYSISKKGTAVIMSTHNPAWVQEFPATVLRCDNHELHCCPCTDKSVAPAAAPEPPTVEPTTRPEALPPVPENPASGTEDQPVSLPETNPDVLREEAFVTGINTEPEPGLETEDQKNSNLNNTV